MSDEPVTGTQPQQQPVASPATNQTPLSDMVPVARLNGALSKIQELTLQLQVANANVAQKDQEISRLSGDAAQREAELKNAVGEKEKSHANLQDEVKRLTVEVNDLKAYRLKVEVAADLKVPGLIEILDVIPNAPDKDTQTSIMQRFQNFAGNISQAREKELTAGNTGPAILASNASEPNTTEGWQKHVNSLPLGSPERDAAMKKWHAFTFKRG